jgi:dethiobiotin synthetase
VSQGVFITGTDTGSGKTEVAVALLQGLTRAGQRAVGFKPVASGAGSIDGNLRNDDALALQQAGAPGVPYADINPYCFAPAIAPHLAARDAGVTIDAGRIAGGYRRLAAGADWVVVEGAGGWRVPLSDALDMRGLALALNLPVILVVGLRLGCINHALLSEQSIVESGSILIGWIGSAVDPAMERMGDNIQTLSQALRVPCLGVWHRDRDAAVADRLASNVQQACRPG